MNVLFSTYNTLLSQKDFFNDIWNYSSQKAKENGDSSSDSLWKKIFKK